MTRKLMGSALGAFGIATDVVRHVAWYVNHQVNGKPRDAS